VNDEIKVWKVSNLKIIKKGSEVGQHNSISNLSRPKDGKMIENPVVIPFPIKIRILNSSLIERQEKLGSELQPMRVISKLTLADFWGECLPCAEMLSWTKRCGNEREGVNLNLKLVQSECDKIEHYCQNIMRSKIKKTNGFETMVQSLKLSKHCFQ